MEQQLRKNLQWLVVLMMAVASLLPVQQLFAQDGGAPSVTASDQTSDGSTVTVDSVTATVDGWMVIHADADGAPGPVLGQTAVMAGVTDNVVVALEPALEADSSLWAMLHVDEGTVGVYEFPGADVPVKNGDAIVMAPFMVTLGQAMLEDSMTEGAMAEAATTDETMVEEAMVEEPMAEAAMTDETVTDETVAEAATTDETMVEEAMVEEPMVEETMVEEPMAEAAMTDETMAADQAPDHMPVTGGESNNGLNMALIAALVVFLLGALAVASRRRIA
jgi:hypothetical protein